jgi:Na+-transporting NADH:ubiquinone oxidoreductase subunit A
MHRVKRGLSLPIIGEAALKIDEKFTKTVALVASDYLGMKPSMKVQEGDRVKTGSPLFEDKKVEGIVYTSPVTGTVKAISRGERRHFQSLVIEVDQRAEYHTFSSYTGKRTSELKREEIVSLMNEAGLWNTLRTRPYSATPALSSKPHSIFITATDTNPLAPLPDIFIKENQTAFTDGVRILSRLTDGNTYVCVGGGYQFFVPIEDKIRLEVFTGPHPAGNAGTHIHYLDPVHAKKSVWTIGYQDVIAVGKVFGSGRLFADRLITLAGPQATNSRYIKTTIGADLMELTGGEILAGETRIVSGSVFYGHTIKSGPEQYLRRFSNQVTLLKEDREREFLGWHSPGFDKYSIMRTFLSKLVPGKKFAFATSTNGSHRSMVPVGAYEQVMPLDILPTHLLKSLVSKDSDTAQQLGCLELDEEDLALCTFVDPGKVDYGPILRQNLTLIEKEG